MSKTDSHHAMRYANVPSSSVCYYPAGDPEQNNQGQKQSFQISISFLRVFLSHGPTSSRSDLPRKHIHTTWNLKSSESQINETKGVNEQKIILATLSAPAFNASHLSKGLEYAEWSFRRRSIPSLKHGFYRV